ncbi:MAG: CheR family methyltransferase, partial [Polyangiaceae bacterium]
MRTAGDVRRSARLRDAVGTRLGLQFDEDRADVLAAALARRAAACGESEDRYVARIESDATREEIQALARELTVGETYFFRHVQQLRALSERVLPDLLSARAQVGRLRLLSAGCASGEEAFTLRMMVAEHPAASRWDVDVVGLDVNEASIESARAGQFSAWSLRETPADARERWFRRSGQGFVLDEALRGSVRLEPRNLVDDDPAFWGPGAFDVVFCRNVLMYMTPPAAGAIVGRLVRSLAPGGYLFLGHAETLGASPPMLELCHTHETFYYRRREVDGAITRAIPGSGPAPAVGDDPAAWRVAIERSIAHIDRLDG